MKARDLAALAALGIAGKYAYDKFGGKKDDEPKTRGELGKSQSANDGDAGESEARMSKRDMNEGSGRRDAGGNTEKLSRQELDVPDRMSRQERDVPDRIMGKDAAGSSFTGRDVAATPAASSAYKKVKDKSSGAVAAKATTDKAADTKDDRFVSPEEGAKAYVPRRTPGAADGVGATFSSTEEGMKSYVPRRPGQTAAPAPTFSSSEAGMKSYVPRRTGQTPSAVQTSSTARKDDRPYVGSLKGSGEKSMMDKYRESDMAKGFQAARKELGDTPAIDAVMDAGKAGMLMAATRGRMPLKSYSQPLLGGPAGKPALGAPGTAALPAPAKQLTGPSKADLMARDRANRANSREDAMLRENAERYGLNPNAPGYDATASNLRNQIGGRDFTLRKKGGVVRMASGGMTSSKTSSKPSGASRGDGIAQRGRTRGTLR